MDRKLFSWATSLAATGALQMPIFQRWSSQLADDQPSLRVPQLGFLKIFESRKLENHGINLPKTLLVFTWKLGYIANLWHRKHDDRSVDGMRFSLKYLKSWENPTSNLHSKMCVQWCSMVFITRYICYDGFDPSSLDDWNWFKKSYYFWIKKQLASASFHIVWLFVCLFLISD